MPPLQPHFGQLRDRALSIIHRLSFRYTGIMLALILLTSLDGKPIWVESSAVVIIRTQSHECQDGHGSVIRVGSNALCVREKPDQIRELIYNADRH